MGSEWILGRLAVSGQGPVAGCCECGDEPSGSCATELVTTQVDKTSVPTAQHSDR
jgi:hypothetical protein